MLAPVVIFLGAFLSFLVQPLIGNTLLPIFGGTASVWSVCLASFQILLVAGYFYAHGTAGLLRRGASPLYLHVLLVGGAGLWLFGSVGEIGRTIFGIGVAFVLLSANSTLVQVLAGGRYRLYAVSNVGSIVGLLAYPLVFELNFPLSVQWRIFSLSVVVYAVLFLSLAVRRAQPAAGASDDVRQDVRLDARQCLLLSFASCYLLNGVSTHLCSDITPLPLLWAWLLVLYLLSYVIAFSDGVAGWALKLSALVVPLCGFAAWTFGTDIGLGTFLPELAVGSCVLFFGGLVVHARLYRLRPRRQDLSLYYLCIAAGGAAGGAVCSFAMPFVSTIVAEYPIALAMVVAAVLCDIRELLPVAFPRGAVRVAAAGLVLFAAFGLCRGCGGYVSGADGAIVRRYRNFYGTGYVLRHSRDLGFGLVQPVNELRSGATTHGYQRVEGDWFGQNATCYYGERAGGMAILSHPKRAAGQPLRVAVCGMGIGTLATHARAGDSFRFYEINPAVAEIAADTRFFTFLGKADGIVDVVVDDARRALERERAANEPKYDVMVVDVFTGDAIPAHLMTKEAFALYLDRMDEDGILAFHLSNWHLDLLPMVKAAMREFGLQGEAYFCKPTKDTLYSTWAFLSRKKLALEVHPDINCRLNLADARDIPLMADDRHSIIPYLKFSK